FLFSSAAIASSFARSRDAITTRAPASASALVRERPYSPPPPVSTTTLSLRLKRSSMLMNMSSEVGDPWIHRCRLSKIRHQPFGILAQANNIRAQVEHTVAFLFQLVPRCNQSRRHRKLPML